MKKLIIGTAFVSIALLLSACATNGSNPELASISDSGLVSVLGDTTYDWEDINIRGGDVEHVFTLKNAGDEDLIIKGANTTCMCTTAVVETESGVKSPKFGMHGKILWGYPIKPDEEFKVRVTFDPMAHGPDAVGPIKRSVFLYTSSKPNAEFTEVKSGSDAPATELKVIGNVI